MIEAIRIERKLESKSQRSYREKEIRKGEKTSIKVYQRLSENIHDNQKRIKK